MMRVEAAGVAGGWSEVATQVLSGPPRRILLVLGMSHGPRILLCHSFPHTNLTSPLWHHTGWDVGDDPEPMRMAALAISVHLAVVTACIYVLCQLACCDSASRRRKRAALEGPPVLSAAGTPLDELWTVHNKRYDMRRFVASHPGGAAAILLGQGRNCTELFESYHSLSNEARVAAALKRCYVEDAPAGSRDFENEFNWHETPVWSALKMRVRAHFDRRPAGLLGTGHRADGCQWLQLLCFIGASAVALRSFMCGELAGAVALPFCYWWGPSPCMHDGGHFSLCRRPWLNTLFAHIGGAHMSLFSWQYQHTVGHHVHTNISGRDPDLYHFNLAADSGLPGFRTSLHDRTIAKSSNGIPRERWWRRGLWLRAPLTSFGPSILWDAMSLMNNGAFAGSFLGLVAYPIGLSDSALAMHSVGRCVVIWLAIIHPITVCLVTASGWLYGAIAACLFVICPYAVHGCLFYMFSQVSHVQEECHRAPRAALDRERAEAEVGSGEPWCSAYIHEHPLDKLALHQKRLREAMTASSAPREAGAQHQQDLAHEAERLAVTQAQAQGDPKRGTATTAAAVRIATGDSTLHQRHQAKSESTKTDGGSAFGSAAIGPLPPQAEAGAAQQEWAVHQMGHALDYAVGSRLWLHVSNGLNLQVVHHLFPQVGWGHYIELSKIIAEVAKEHGLTYNVKPGFREAMGSHLQYLARINDSDQDGSIWVTRPFHVPLPQPRTTGIRTAISPAAGRASTAAAPAGPGGSLLEALWLLDQLDTLPDGTPRVPTLAAARS